MADTDRWREPWLCFHAPWTQRGKSGMAILERIQRFLDACAVDPAPDSLEMTIPERVASPLPALVAAATETFGASDGREGGTSGPGSIARWTWSRRAQDGVIDAAPFVDFYRRHEHLPPLAGHHAKRAVCLMLNYWFEVKRPGASAPLFPGAAQRSSVMIWLDSRHANLVIRYQSPELTPDLRAAHAAIVATLGPKTPRHAFQRIIPARTPRGRERKEPLI